MGPAPRPLLKICAFRHVASQQQTGGCYKPAELRFRPGTCALAHVEMGFGRSR